MELTFFVPKTFKSKNMIPMSKSILFNPFLIENFNLNGFTENK